MLKTKVYSKEIVEELGNENGKDDREGQEQLASPTSELARFSADNAVSWRDTYKKGEKRFRTKRILEII